MMVNTNIILIIRTQSWSSNPIAHLRGKVDYAAETTAVGPVSLCTVAEVTWCRRSCFHRHFLDISQCGNLCRAFLLPAIVSSSKDMFWIYRLPWHHLSGVHRQAEEERADLKNSLSSANSRLAKMDALEADTKAHAEELEKLRGERREREESLAEEQGRTQHLVTWGNEVFLWW